MRRGMTILALLLLISTPVWAREWVTPSAFKQWTQFPLGKPRGSAVWDDALNAARFLTYDSKSYIIFQNDETLSDCRVTARFKVLKLNNKYSGFNLRVRRSPKNSYWLYYRPLRRSLHIIKELRGKTVSLPIYNSKAKYAPKVELGEECTLVYEVRGRKFTVSINGEEWITAEDNTDDLLTEGRVTWAAGAADLELLSLRIENLETLEKLPVTYRYPNRPEKGDPEGRALTDGKVNEDPEQPFWGLNTKGAPEVLFRFDKPCVVRRMKLKAYAVPGKNIAAVRVLRKNKERWEPVETILNEATDMRPQVQTLEKETFFVAEEVKIEMIRPAADSTLRLAEVAFFGRQARPEDRQRKIERPYYTGPMPPDTSITGREDANYYYLESGPVRLPVSKAHGFVGPIYDAAGKRRLTLETVDQYFLDQRPTPVETEESENIVEKAVWELDDRVLRLTCRNPKLPDVDIEIVYTAIPDKEQVNKETRFRNRSTDPARFMTVGSQTVLDQAFHDGGWHFGAARALSGKVWSGDVAGPTLTTLHAPLNGRGSGYINYAQRRGIAQYRYKINGEYVFPVSNRWVERKNQGPVYLPNGWSLGFTTLQLKPGDAASVETHLSVFPDDEYYYYKKFREQLDVAAAYEIDRPRWLTQLKSSVPAYGWVVTPNNREYLLDWVRRSVDLHDEGYYYFLLQSTNVWGDWWEEGRYGYNNQGFRSDKQLFKELIARIHEISPRVKVFLYSWAWCGMEESRAFQEHPEWFIMESKDGAPLQGYSNARMNFLRNIGMPGSTEWLLSGVDKVMAYYGLDGWYLDGGGSGANQIDWKHVHCDTDADWNRFHNAIRERTRRFGPDKAFFLNARTTGAIDLGFYEGINTKLNRASWRDAADGLLGMKIRQAFNMAQRHIPYYWRANTLPYYSNYCVGLGLTPSNTYAFEDIQRTGYVEVAYEVRMARWIPAHPTPDWRRDPETQVEVHTLRQGPAAFVSVINHEEAPIPQTVSVERDSLGLPAAGPLYQWCFRVKDIRTRTYGASAHLGKKVHADNHWGVNLVMKPVFLGVDTTDHATVAITRKWDPELLNMVSLTPSAAVAYSKAGRRMNLWLPDVVDVSVMGTVTDNAVTVNKTGDDETEALVFVPNEWRALKVSGAKDRGRLVLHGQRFALIGFATGDGQATIRAGKRGAAAFAESCPLPNLPETLRAGERYTVTAPAEGERYFLTIFSDGTPVHHAVNRDGKFTLHLPEEAENEPNAAVELTVLSEKGYATYRAETSIASAYVYPAIHPGRHHLKGPPIRRYEKCDVTARGVHVVAGFVDTHDGYSRPLHAEVDPETLRFSAGNLDAPDTRYGHSFAGIESDNLKVVTLALRNTSYGLYHEGEYLTNKKGGPNDFAGLIADYHTPAGWTHRVALGMGVLRASRKSGTPVIDGTARKFDRVVRLNNFLHERNEMELTLDLGEWAPKDWDGRVRLSAGCDNLLPGRRIYVEILENRATPGDRSIERGDVVAMQFVRPKHPLPLHEDAAIAVNGKLDEAVWERLKPMTGLVFLRDLNPAPQKTVARMFRDNERFYLGVECLETERTVFLDSAAKSHNRDALDLAFVVEEGADWFHKFVIDCNGSVDQYTVPIGRPPLTGNPVVATRKTPGKGWTLEMSLPLSELKAAGRTRIPFNLNRYRPSGSGVQYLTWSPIPIFNLMNPEYFGELRLE